MSRIEELTLAYLDGTLEPGEEKELEQLLEEDEEAREVHFALLDQEAVLRGERRGQDPSAAVVARVRAARAWTSHPALRLAAAAGILLALASGALLVHQVRSREPETREAVLFARETLTPGMPTTVRTVIRDGEFDRPLARAQVELSLVPAAGGDPVWQHTATSDEGGLVVAALDLHEGAVEGAHTLHLNVAHGGWTEHLEQTVSVQRRYRILVSTDKPLYQPGQTIHLHALALAEADGRPAAGHDVLFEVADARGNKVFKQRETASDYGIAAADFALADLVDHGDYTVTVTLGEAASERVVRVERYVLPRFAVELTPERPFGRPGETLWVHLRARYTFGEPVAGGIVEVEASEFVEDFRPFATFEGVTGDDGGLSFDLELPSTLVGQPGLGGDALVSLEAVVTDGAGHEQRTTADLTVSERGTRVDLIAEGGRLVRGLENTVYVLTSAPDGTPVSATVTLEGLDEPLETDATGFARIGYTPDMDAEGWRPHLERERDYLRYEVWGSRHGSRWDEVGREVTWHRRTDREWDALWPVLDGARSISEEGPVDAPFYLTATVADRQGNTDVHRLRLDMGWRDGSLVLAADRPVYTAGDRARILVLSNAPSGRVFLDLVRAGQVITSTALDLEDGRAELVLDLPADLAGTAELVAYRVLDDGQIASGTRVVQIRRADELRVTVTADRDRYRPGEVARLALKVRDRGGDPHRAALWLAGVDEAVFALAEMRPGLARVFFELQRELLRPRYEIHASGWHDPERLLHSDPSADPATQDDVLAVLAAATGTGAPPAVRGETYEQRTAFLARQRANLVKDAALIPVFATLPLAALVVLAALILLVTGTLRRAPADPGATYQGEALRASLRLSAYWTVGFALPFLLQFHRYGGWGAVVLALGGAVALAWLVALVMAVKRTRGFLAGHGAKLVALFPSWVMAGSHLSTAEMSWGGRFDDDPARFLLGHLICSAVSLGLFGLLVGWHTDAPGRARQVARAVARWWLPAFWIPYGAISLLFVAELAPLGILVAGLAIFAPLAVGWMLRRHRRVHGVGGRPGPFLLAPSIGLATPLVGWSTIEISWSLRHRGVDLGEQALALGGIAAVALLVLAAAQVGRVRRPGSPWLGRIGWVSARIAIVASVLVALRALHWHGEHGVVSMGFAACFLYLAVREVRWLIGLPPVGVRPTLVAGLRLLPPALALVFLGTLSMGGDGGLALVHLLNWAGASFDEWAFHPRMEYGDLVLASGDLFAVTFPIVIGLLVACGVLGGALALAGTQAARWANLPARLGVGLALAALLASPWLLLRTLPFGGPASMGVGAASAEQKEELLYSGLGLSKPFEDVRTAGRDRPPGDEGAGEALKAPDRVRRHFPETLLWTPQLVTDKDGNAELEVPLADSITTWRLSVGAVTRGGALGSAEAGLVVHQDFFVDLDLPVALTRGDETAVPVALYSYLDRSQSIRLELQPAPWFEVVGPTTRAARLGPGGSDHVDYRIRALEPGDHVLRVLAHGSQAADAVERRVRVVPDGERVVETVNGRLAGPARHRVTFPADAVAGGSELRLKVYPGTFSQILEGMDGIFRMPYGCFEQTSSVTYPNLLALDYLRSTGRSLPEVEARALSYVRTGYQRLLSFEVEGGGFEWFGEPPAHTVLTAYGLMEFHDMAQVIPVDEAVIRRTREWLYRQQIEDGAWVVNGRDHGGAIGQLDEDRLLTTAYVAWALAETGEKDARLTRALDLLAGQLDAVDDPYTLGLCASAFVAADHRSAGAALARLDTRVRREGGMAWWSSDSTGATYGRGAALDAETTAIAAHAYLRADHDVATAHGALAWLLEQRSPGGTWGTTQATVHAMRAILLGSTEAEGLTEDVVLRIAVDGQEAGGLTITPDQADVHHLVDLGRFATAGAHEVDLDGAVDGAVRGALAYQIVAVHHRPWIDRPADTGAEPLVLDVDYDATRIPVGHELTCQVTVTYQRPGAAPMILVDLGIPPGFDLLTDDLDNLRVYDTIERYEVSGSQLIVYLRSVEQGAPVRFQYRLRARYPVQAQTPPSSAYPYYEPTLRADAPPVELQAI